MSLFIQIVVTLLVWAWVSIYSKIKEANKEHREYQDNVELHKRILSKHNAPDPEIATDDECLNFAEKHRDDSFVIMTYYDYGRLIGYPIERKKEKKNNS